MSEKISLDWSNKHEIANSRVNLTVSPLAHQRHFIPTIARWYFNEWAHLSPNISLEEIEAKVTAMAESDTALPISFVLYRGGELLAVAELKHHEHPSYPDYTHWLGGVFVPMEKRGQSYSTMVLRHALEHAKTEGLTSLYLQCELHNVDLYVKHDFVVMHRLEEKGVSKAIMVRRFH